MSDRDAKGNENVIPAKAGIQKTKELDSRLHGNDGLEVFSGENIKRQIAKLSTFQPFILKDYFSYLAFFILHFS